MIKGVTYRRAKRSETMSLSKSVRQLVQFLKPPGDDFKCPICLDILREPHLTTCCGNHHLCKVCMDTVKKSNGKCPLCQKKPFNGFIDKRFERQLHEMKVYCIYKPKGCEWVGNFGKIDQHLNIGNCDGECQFVVIECPVSLECKKHFLRKYLINHISNICEYRETECSYCGFVSTYKKITTLHPNKCTKYPLLCPNECSNQTYPRDQLDAHLASCPEQKIDCTFSEMGCKEKIKRRVLQQHLDTNILQHQIIMCQAFKEMKKEKQDVEEQLESLKKDKKELEMKLLKFSNQEEDNQIKSLKLMAKTNIQLQLAYFANMEEFSNLYPVAPLVLKESFEITKHYCRKPVYTTGKEHYTCSKPYESQFFYSHPNGYKLQVSVEVMCHCSNCRSPQKKEQPPTHPYDEWHGNAYYDAGHRPQQAVHNSDVPSYCPGGNVSLAVNLYIFKGDHDSELKWPFKEEITITMYQENEYRHHRALGGRCIDGKNQYYIPNETAIFEGNQNHTSSGSRLGIKSLIERNKVDVFQLLQLQRTRQESYVQHQVHREKVQQQKLHACIEKGLLFPLNLRTDRATHWNDQVYNETVYFEITFSRQLLC